MSPTIVTMEDVLWERESYRAAPNHIRIRLKCAEPAILVDEKKNVIVAANEAWCRQCGFREEAIGASPKILHGPLTDHEKASRFTQRVLQDGRAGMTLVNYKSDGSPFKHTIVADKAGAFFFAKSKLAVDVSATEKAPQQIFAIAVALQVAYAFVRIFPALATDTSPSVVEATVSTAWGHPSVFVQPNLHAPSLVTLPSHLAAEAVTLAGFFFLAFLVAAVDSTSSDKQPEEKQAGKHFEEAIFGSLLVGLAAVILSEAPRALVGDLVPIKPALVSLALAGTARLATKEAHGARVRHDEVYVAPRSAVPLAEILTTTAACICLVTFQVPLQVQ